MTRICFIHGWAYSSQLWNKLETLLSGYESEKVDLGFFGGKFIASGPYDAVITHSYGLMWLLKTRKIKFKKLISISGIASYTKSKTLTSGIPKSQLRAMRQKLHSDPEDLLREFYQACGDTSRAKPGEGDLNTTTLLEALKDMETLDIREKLQNLEIRALASREDKIVPQELTKENFASHQILWHDNDSHVLPKTDPEWCARAIKEFINA